LAKSDYSKEKNILIKGIVNGEPMQTRYGGDTSWDDIKFSIKLITDITATFKKFEPSILQSGTSIVVNCRESCYIRIGDQIELFGRIGKLLLSNGIVSHFITTSKLYNETLQLSFNY
jgi:hypothetical protein